MSKLEQPNRPLRVEDFLSPVTDYRPGIPAIIRDTAEKRLSVYSPPELKSLLERSYYSTLELLERIFGEDVPLETEEDAKRAAYYAGQLILDGAWLHHYCCVAGIIVGEYPYDKYVHVLFPEKELKKQEEGTGEEPPSIIQ